MKTFILTEGSKSIGFGHITRCIALFDELKKRQLNPQFVVNGDKSTKDLLKNKNYIIFNWIRENQRREALLKNSDCVIIDSYLTPKTIYPQISTSTKLLVCIDDNNRLAYPAGIVTNGSIHSQSLNYPKSTNIKYLLGSQYILLRKEFSAVTRQKSKKAFKTIFITFGGDDLKNLTLPVLSMVIQKFPKINKIVVIAPGFKKKNIALLKKTADKKTKFVFSPIATEMKRNMQQADIAISAAGQTLNELARVGLPTVAVIVAKNQRNHAIGWQKNGFIINVGNWNEKNLLGKINKGLIELTSQKQRQHRKRIGQSLVDGRGPERIVNKIISKLSK